MISTSSLWGTRQEGSVGGGDPAVRAVHTNPQPLGAYRCSNLGAEGSTSPHPHPHSLPPHACTHSQTHSQPACHTASQAQWSSQAHSQERACTGTPTPTHADVHTYRKELRLACPRRGVCRRGGAAPAATGSWRRMELQAREQRRRRVVEEWVGPWAWAAGTGGQGIKLGAPDWALSTAAPAS